MKKIDAYAFGTAFAIIEAIAVLVVWLIGVYGASTEPVELMAMIYYGFDTTFQGLVVGVVEALFVGFVFGYLAAWVYNKKAKE